MDEINKKELSEIDICDLFITDNPKYVMRITGDSIEGNGEN